ncbi:nuclear transport factor 2 family protein [Modestobacter sp. NPDC049651]|uniref:nuclear transport factor 2 family protein n=1 Tax=unclassified Modestobacter TaxID=2643866 RepID=UPI0033C260B0
MDTDTTLSPAQVAERYFSCWLARDFDGLRALLADDVTFDGPLATLSDADSCVAGLRGMSQIVTDVVVHHRFVDGPDVLTWFDLHTSVAPPVPTANWTHVADGRITAIRVAFDARALAPA